VDAIEYVRKRIEPWLKRQLYAKNEKYGVCEKIILRHMRVDGGAGSEVYTYLADDDPSLMDPGAFEILINEIAQASADHANGFAAGVQRYSLFSYFSLLQTSPSNFPFYVQGETPEAVSADGVPTEPATKEGMIAMQMRHNDAILRTSVMAMGGVVATLQKMNSRLADQNEHLVDDRLNNLKLVEDLMSAKHERELDVRKQEKQFAITGELLDKVKVFIPFMVNKMAGSKIMPEPTTPESLLVRSIVETLTPQQMEGLKHILRPEQTIALLEVAEAEIKRQAAERNGQGSGTLVEEKARQLRALTEGKSD